VSGFAAQPGAQSGAAPEVRDATGSRPSPRELYSARRPARARRLALWHAGWLPLASGLLLSLIGVYCINLTGGVNADGFSPLAKKQLVFAGLGLIGAAIVAIPHYRLIMHAAPLLVAAALALLVFVLLPFVPEALVTPRNGSRRWISLGFTDFQPSELAKVAFVLAMASYLRFRKNHRRFLGLLPPAIITLIPMALIVLEPDLGTALLFLPALGAMLVAAGARLVHLILILAVMGVSAPAMYPLLKPHQKQRIQAMINQITGDTSEADGINYQGFKAMTLVGAGGVTGLGASKSRAVIDFNELPEDHNDMVFAVVTNRFGMLGGMLVMGLYLAWIGGALWAAGVCKDPFGRLLIVGITAIIASQAIFNMAICVGLLPITGMTLPFISYGGSSLVSVFLMTGLVFNVAMRRPPPMARESFDFDRERGKD
jgi:cell division protein FtsW (lipid II flippase)